MIRILFTAFLVALLPSEMATAQDSDEPVATWTLREIRRIGSIADSRTALTGVTHALVDPAGRLYVLQPLDREVRAFSAAGDPLWRAGGRGNGPGEFSSPRAMGWADGGFYVVDGSSGRIAVFGEDGELKHDWRPTPPRTMIRHPPAPAALMAGGTVLFNMRRAIGAADGTGVSERFILVDSNGAVAGPALEVSRHRLRYAIRNPATPVLGFFANQPIADSPLMAVDPHGEFVVTADRRVESYDAGVDRVPVTVRLHPVADRPPWTLTLRIPVVPITRAERDSIFTAEWEMVREARGPGLSAPEKRKALEAALFLPEVRPPVDRLIVDSEGNTWLRVSADRRWLVLDGRGRLIAQAIGAGDVAILDHRDGVVVGTVRDALEVPYLVVLRRATH